MLSQLHHRFEVWHVVARLASTLRIIVHLCGVLVVGHVAHAHGLVELVDSLEVVLRSECLLHQTNLEERDFVCIDVAFLPQTHNLVLDVANVLVVRDVDVVLEDPLDDLLLALWHVCLILFLDGLLQIRAQVLLHLGLLLEKC